MDEQHAVADRAYAANGLRDWNASRSCWEGRIGAAHAKHATGTEAPRHAQSAPARHAAKTARTYTVRKGDTLGKIAAAHRTTVNALMAANCGVIENADRIFPGERLRV